MSNGAFEVGPEDNDFDGEDTLVDIDGNPFDEAEACRWDDDPSPYEGNYSED